MAAANSGRRVHDQGMTPPSPLRNPASRRLLAATLLLAASPAQDTQHVRDATLRHGRDHADHGLPIEGAQWRAHHGDPDHLLNRIWRRLYLTRCVPTEVAAALPAEHGDEHAFFVQGWYFGKRPGEAADERLFGGDGRQMPVEGYTQAEAEELTALLAAVDGDVVEELHRRKRTAVWFQHDLFRLMRRLLDTKQNPELLLPLRECAQRVALPREVLQSRLVRTFDAADVADAVDGFSLADSVEVARRSSRLFDAEWVQLWSTIHLQMPQHTPAETAAWLTAGTERPPVPMHTTALLLQGIVAVDDQGRPCATDLVIEARLQQLQNRDPLAADNPTTTRDGVTFRMWSLERSYVYFTDDSLTAVPFEAAREIDMQSQELFRDYGTRKHTTYAAQCSLCHRRTHGPDEALAGFSALRTGSQPHRAEPGERRRLAETEMLRFLDKLPSR